MKKFVVGLVIFYIFAIAFPFINQASAADLRVGDGQTVEGNGGMRSVEILVVLSTPATAPVTVSYTTQNGTAADGADYQAANGTVTFAKGDSSKRIKVNVIGDLAIEADETFKIVLSNPSGATIAGGSGTVTIVDDDKKHGVPTYEIRLTATGDSGNNVGTEGCPSRKNGRDVLEGIISGNEKVAADDNIEYEGTLWLDVDIDLCEADRLPNKSEDFLCGITVIGNALVKTNLSVYADDRGGYLKTSDVPGASNFSMMFGTPSSPCTQPYINGVIPTFPNETFANLFQAAQLQIPSGPLKVQRYNVQEGMVLEVIRKIP